MEETAMSHYGNWIGVIIWVLIYGVFIFFTPFYKKSQRKPTTAYLAFIVAYALEMFGMLCEWATLPLLIMYPILIIIYTRLAKKEEQDMMKEFNEKQGEVPDFKAM